MVNDEILILMNVISMRIMNVQVGMLGIIYYDHLIMSLEALRLSGLGLGRKGKWAFRSREIFKDRV